MQGITTQIDRSPNNFAKCTPIAPTMTEIDRSVTLDGMERGRIREALNVGNNGNNGIVTNKYDTYSCCPFLYVSVVSPLLFR